MASEAAECAKDIKKELKALWPKVKFSVKSDYFSMGNSVSVKWVYGPTRTQVDKVIRKYQHGSFDGMTDCYNYSKTTTAHSAKYVSGDRDIPYDVLLQVQQDLAKALKIEWQGQATRKDGMYLSELAYRVLARWELPNGYQGLVETKDPDGALFQEDWYDLIGGIKQPRY